MQRVREVDGGVCVCGQESKVPTCKDFLVIIQDQTTSDNYMKKKKNNVLAVMFPWAHVCHQSDTWGKPAQAKEI